MQERSSIGPDDAEPAAPMLNDDDGEVGRKEGKNESKIKNPAAVALGRLGGLKGGRARAEKLTPTQRSEVARRAARTRWSARGK